MKNFLAQLKKAYDWYREYDFTLPSDWRKNIAVGIVVLCMLLGYLLSKPVETKGLNSALVKEKVVVEMQNGKTHEFTFEIARSAREIERGLMFRDEMDEDDGMMFLFHKPQPVSFWMKDVHIPLDMLFVASDGKIINIHRNAKPGSLDGVSSGGPVTSVIEINGGRADEVGLAIGDKVDHRHFRKTPPKKAEKSTSPANPVTPKR